MKAEGLMVGDLLTFKDCVGDSGFPILKVNGILPDTLFVRIDYSDADDEVDYEDIIGIPLTPEILEKNGFRFVKADRMFPADRYFWGVEGTRDGAIVEITFYNPDVHGVKVLTRIHTQSSHESGINSVHSCDIESVHELQHALRLCGIEKEIVI